MKSHYLKALSFTTCLVGTVLAATSAKAIVAPCPATINGATFAGITNPVRGVVIEDQCRFVYVTRSTGNVVEIRDIASITGAPTSINVGPNPVGLDTTPDGTTLYVANSGENSVSVVGLQNPGTFTNPPKITLPLTGASVGLTPLYVAVASNQQILISTNGASGAIQLFQYDPVSNSFRNRTADITGGISAAVLDATGDRTRINGIVSVSGQAWAYAAATDTFVTTTASTAVAADGTISTLNSAGTLRYSTNPNSVAGKSTLAVTNVRTGAVVARMTINAGVAASLPNALSVSADGSQAALLTTNGFQLIDIAPAVTVRSMIVSSLYSPSFLRVHNSGAADGTVRIAMRNAATGVSFGTWTSPVIAAGSEAQFPVSTIEAALNITDKPFRYAIELDAPVGFFGTFQHIIWNPTTGTLANISSCDRELQGSGALDVALLATDASQLSAIHSSALTGYPSQIHITSTSNTSQTAVLDIYNANTGALLGTYTSASIAAGGQLSVAVSDIEVATNIVPSASVLHYVVVARAPFTGFLQHRLLNQTTGTFADMSAGCVINGDLQTNEAAASITGATTNTIRLSSLYSTTQSTTQSFLRLSNESTTAQTATVALSVPEGTRVWTSPSIPAGAEIQVPIATIEAEVPAFTKPTFYGATVTMGFEGSVQHVVWRPSTGTFTNLSTCIADGSDDLTRLTGVHSTLLTAYPSYIVLNNNLNFASSVNIFVHDARTGTLLGTYISPEIAGRGNIVVTMAQIQTAIGLTPTGDTFHYNLIGRISELNGVSPNYFLQHLVLNQSTGTLEDMTKSCRPN